MKCQSLISSISISIVLFVFIVSVQSIHISTPDFETIYSGPGGVPTPGWDTLVDPVLYTNHMSVAQFLIAETQEDSYYYASIQEVFGPPIIKVESGKDVVDPMLFGIAADGYFFDGTSYWEELPDLNVYFNCQKEGRAVVSIMIMSTLLFTDEGPSQSINETITFYFEKDCYSSGNREGFSIGYGDGRTDDVVRHGVTQQRWVVESYYYLDKNPIIVDEDEHMSVFHVSISSPLYGNQFFYEPSVFIEDDEVLEVTLRGNAQSGGVATSMAETLVLVYDCIGDGSTEVTVNIPLGFFGTVQFGFSKVCTPPGIQETEMPGLINVGTSRSDYAGVVSNSITSLFWQVGQPTVEIPADEIATNFYVSTTSGKVQELLKPIVTVNPPSAFPITLSGNIRDGGVVTGSPQHFTVNYLCDRVADATIVVTLKMPNAKTVEYSYTKQCKALRRHHDQVWTANQLLITFILCTVAVVVSAYILYRKKQSKKVNRKSRV